MPVKEICFMLLKSDVPLSHRAFLVFGITFTFHVFMTLVRTSQFAGVEALIAVLLCLAIIYTSVQRRRWRMEDPEGNLATRYNSFDRLAQPLQTWFNEASLKTLVIYHLVIFGAALLIYKLMV
jgi:hypothetical protein